MKTNRGVVLGVVCLALAGCHSESKRPRGGRASLRELVASHCEQMAIDLKLVRDRFADGKEIVVVSGEANPRFMMLVAREAAMCAAVRAPNPEVDRLLNEFALAAQDARELMQAAMPTPSNSAERRAAVGKLSELVDAFVQINNAPIVD